jgi:plasmid stabilization system protein ParE
MMLYEVEWKQGAVEDITLLFEYILENSSFWDAKNVTERLINSTDKLAEFPRLYEVDSRYGEDVRRISLMGQNVLYEVDDPAKKVRILAVAGQRQNPISVR